MSGYVIEYANSNPVLIITPQGQLNLGEGASVDQATQALFEMLEANFSSEIARRKTRIEAQDKRIEALEVALREIAESDDIENALDPARNKRIARAALKGE